MSEKRCLTWDAICDFGVERFFEAMHNARSGLSGDASSAFGDLMQAWNQRGLRDGDGASLQDVYTRWLRMRIAETEYLRLKRQEEV